MDDHREDVVRARAKEIWEAEGKPEGRDDEFWFRAAEEFDAGRLMTAEPETPAPHEHHENSADHVHDQHDDHGHF